MDYWQRTLSLLFCILSNAAFSQQESANWYFGDQSGLNFNIGNPAPVTGAIRSVGGSAVISHAQTGKLLFYTDGRNFWNRAHEVMQNAHTLPYNCFTRITQPAIIVPSVAGDSLFHVLCIRATHEIPPLDPNNCVYAVDKSKIPEGESGLGLYYYLIDMRLNGGMGNVVEGESNVLLQTNITEKITAVPHANGKDYWIIVHGWKNRTFYSVHWSDGRIVDWVTSEIGSVHGDYGGIYFEDELRGELKASPDGKKIACAVFSDYRPFDLFDFDNSTGKLSNYINLGDIREQYGISFSPDNSKLYASSGSRDMVSDRLHIILQYDLEAGEAAALAASGMSVIVQNPKTNIPNAGIFNGWSTSAKGMALALDGRLYISANEPRDGATENHTLVVIENPNERGFNCNINYKRFAFHHGKTGIGLPNFMQSYFKGLRPVTECSRSSSFGIYPNPTGDLARIQFIEGCIAEYSLTIMNTLGQTIFTRSSITTGEEIDLSGYADGIYFLIFKPSDNSAIVKKIIKRSF